MSDDDKAAEAYKSLMNQRHGYLTPMMAFIEGAKWKAAAPQPEAQHGVTFSHGGCTISNSGPEGYK